jgi:hypothetical protein
MSMWKQTCENRLANEIGCQLFTPCTLFGKIYPRAIGVVYKCTNTRMIQHIIPLQFAWKAIRDLIINPTPISTVCVQMGRAHTTEENRKWGKTKLRSENQVAFNSVLGPS